MLESQWQDILDYARFAPSGDNSQPWSVSCIDDTTLSVHFLKRNDQDLYQVNLMGEYLGIGAFIETIVQAAQCLNYQVKVILERSDDRVATITLTELPAAERNTSRLKAIKRRATDRRNFHTTPITQTVLQTLQDLSPDHITLFSDCEKFRQLGDMMMLHDTFFWNTPELRNNMLKTFRSGDPRSHKDGMPYASLGLGWETYGLIATLKLAQTFPALWSIIGAKAGLKGKEHFEKSGAIGMLTSSLETPYQAFSPEWHIENGRIFQRLWLEATAQGLAFQPCFGPVAVLFHETFRTHTFSTAQNERSELVTLFKKYFPIPEHSFPIIFFRIGIPKHSPLPHTPRRTLEDLMRPSLST